MTKNEVETLRKMTLSLKTILDWVKPDTDMGKSWERMACEDVKAAELILSKRDPRCFAGPKLRKDLDALGKTLSKMT